MKDTSATTQLDRPRRLAGRSRRSGFTLIEVLVVVGLIVVLVTILLVALAASTSHAAAAKTQALMTSMSQATTQFKRDHTYLPPVLDPFRTYMSPSVVAPGDFAALQDWYSETSPAEYLLGYGNAAQDGANGLGLRSPGLDGVWGASALSGGLADRSPTTAGKVYGAYLEVDADDLLGGMDPNTGVVYAPTDAGYSAAFPKVIVDYFGGPIHYYREHPDRSMNLGDVFVLRPFRIDSGAEAQGAADTSGDRNTTFALKGAPFAYLSLGADREDNHELRFDDPDDPNNTDGTEFANEDNLVEVGQ